MRLKDLKSAGEKAWQERKAGVDAAFDNLKEATQEAAEREVTFR